MTAMLTGSWVVEVLLVVGFVEPSVFCSEVVESLDLPLLPAMVISLVGQETQRHRDSRAF